MKDYLNLGCGSRYHLGWTNIDIAGRGVDVLQHDLSKGIPSDDESFAVVYHAAVLEHLRLQDIKPFLSECHRVLRPGGIMRVGVPDFEALCRVYLEKLHDASKGDEVARHDHEWLMLELFDQFVREKSGGAMIEYLRKDPILNESFVYARIGQEGRSLVQALRKGKFASNLPYFSVSKRILTKISVLFSALRQSLLRLLIGNNGLRALEIGLFRISGEVHHWGFDRLSLEKLLLDTGFRDPIVQGADQSLIPDWNIYHLDSLPDGTVIKPDLFFMEAKK